MECSLGRARTCGARDVLGALEDGRHDGRAERGSGPLRRALAAAAVLVNYLDGENCEAIASVAEGCFASRLLTACRAISEGPGSC